MKVQLIDNIWKRADVPAPDGLYNEFEDALFDALEAEDISGFISLAEPHKKHIHIAVDFRPDICALVKYEGRTIAVIHY